jgi:anti-sigma regulatory factor (Ser/Thr protein kinase)
MSALDEAGDGHAAGAAEGATGGARPDRVRLALDTAGAALWTWDVTTQEAVRPPGAPGLPVLAVRRPEAMAHLVHPDDLRSVEEALAAALAGTDVIDLEFRSRDDAPDGNPRWLLARGHVHRDAAGAPVGAAGILLDVSDRALARAECTRQLHAERRDHHRAIALQRVAAALSEAATSEQVAAVMVEESVRCLGAHAARIEVHAGPAVPGSAAWGHRPDVVRTAGVAALLTPDGAAAAVRTELPLRSRGRLRGRWVLAWRSTRGQPTAAGDWSSPEGTDLLHTLAAECAEALDRAALYEHQRDIATILQRTLLPTVLPGVAGAQVAARYLPGGRGVDVGGDWYDVIALPDGRTALVIGDVEGHSAEAAAVMGQVRGALRAYAVDPATPSAVMARLNRLLVRLGVVQLVTCCYLEFSATEGTATVVLAGHPPPLVVRPDGRTDFVPAPANLVLGVDERAAFVETTVLLDPGTCLLLYTDGLVETVSRALPEGLAALREWARAWDVDDTSDALVEMLVRRAAEGLPVADDLAVLALRYLPADRRLPSRLRAVRRRLPLDPASPAAARRFVTDVLAQWGLPTTTADVSLMTSELVTNAVLHTGGELELGLFLDVDHVRVEVLDRSERLPTLQTPDAEAPGGRGLLVIESLAQAWGVASRGAGKAVWFTVPVDRPDPRGGSTTAGLPSSRVPDRPGGLG